MTATLSQLITAQDQPTNLSTMYTLAASLGVDTVGVQAERLFRALYEIEATAKTREQALRVQITQGAFLDLAAAISSYTAVQAGRTTWLDMLAAGYYGLTRAPASSAVGVVQLTASALASGGNVSAKQFTAGDLLGNLYQNVDAFTVTPGQSVNVAMKAIVAGSQANVPNNSIIQMITTIGGVTVNNPAQVGTSSWLTSAAVDPELNSTLVTRCRARWAATSYGGALGAYAQWLVEAFTTTGLTNTITRSSVDDTNPNGPGSNDVFLANASGPATVNEVAIVNAYLQPRRGLGTGPLRCFTAPAYTVPLSITVYGSLNTAAITAAINELFSSTDLGGLIFVDGLTSTLMAIPGVYNAPISSGTANYPSGSTIKIPTGNVPVAALTLTTTL